MKKFYIYKIHPQLRNGFAVATLKDLKEMLYMRMKEYLIATLGCVSLVLTGCMHQPELRSDAQLENPAQDLSFSAADAKAFEPALPEKKKEKRSLFSRKKKKKKAQKEDAGFVQVVNTLKDEGSIHYKDDIFYVSEYGAPAVQKWENYFTGRGRKSMEKYLDRLPRYEALMKRILKEEGVPEQLIYIALIESGFNSTAYSSARAVGYWQFIRGTGKSYGLKQNWLIDERRDPIKSTRAAAQYFKALYKAFGSWHLAMSSYNAGEHRVLRAIMGNVSRDFWYLHERRQLPRETLDYVPKFIAAAKIASNPSKYGFSHVEGQDPFAYEPVMINKGISLSKLARKLNVPKKEIKRLNPSFKTDFAPIYRGGAIEIRVPVGMGGEKGLLAAKSSVSTKKYLASEGRSHHRVRRGDSLYRIARRYRTSVRTLKRLNGLTNRSVIRPGMKIKLPGSRRVATNRRSSRKVKYVKGSSYKVRSGDTLWSIAQKFGLSVRGLKRLNNLYTSRLRVGQVLRIKATSQSSSKAKSKKRVYYVRRGDNLTKIARRHGVKLSSLIRKNGLRSSSTLSVGKRLYIPN